MKLASRETCSGCSACRSVCAVGAIALKPDEDGFLHPSVDSSKCVRCGRCQDVCPSLHPGPARRPKRVVATRAKDRAVCGMSSSGGAFALLAERMLADGGIVFGAAWDTDWSVVHRRVETSGELQALKGTKYVQSRIGDAYGDAGRALDEGRSVLFSGTPCQIAGLLNVLGGPRENLLTVELICHAVPSPAAWQSYLRTRTAGHGGLVAATVRDKSAGWMKKRIRLVFADGTEYVRPYGEDPFVLSFGGQLVNRPSCHNCRMRSLRSGADVTIGDFWGVERFHPEFADDLGVSAVLLNTDKGEAYFSRLADACETAPSSYANVLAFNHSLEGCPPPHGRRDECLSRLRTEEFDSTVLAILRGGRSGGFWSKVFRWKGVK